MPKATLSFKLPEESEEHRLAIQGSAYARIVEDIDNWLRSKIKYHSSEYTPEALKALQECRDYLTSISQDSYA